MLGAICGDIIGSTREGRKSIFNDHGEIVAMEKDATITPLEQPEKIIHESLTFTDDTVLTFATDKVMRNSSISPESFADTYANFYDMHGPQKNNFYSGPGIGYGLKFSQWAHEWVHGEKRPGYFSRGNGSAMRVSPVAYHSKSLLDVINISANSAQCTHNHPEGIFFAQITAISVWAAIQGANAKEIRELLFSFSPDTESFFNKTEDSLIKHAYFSALASDSVPIAIWAALEGPDFESVMVRCLKIGADTDTIACIAGSIAEPLWGLPQSIATQSLDILKTDGPFLYNEYEMSVTGKYDQERQETWSPYKNWLSSDDFTEKKSAKIAPRFLGGIKSWFTNLRQDSGI